MKNYLFLIVIFITSSSLAQKEAIELPEGGEQLFCCYSYVFDIYADLQRNVYFKDKLLNIQNLNKTIKIEKDKNKVNLGSPRIYLHADKHLKYNFIDSLKSEITKSQVAGNITYITRSKDSINKYGVPKHLEKSISNQNRLKKPIYIISDSLEHGFPKIIKAQKSNIELLFENLYDLNFNEFKIFLSKINYEIMYLNDNELVINNVKIDAEDIEQLGIEMLKYELLFIQINRDLSYQNYVKLSNTIRKSYFHFARKEIRLPIYYEISGELQKELNNNDVKL